MADTIEIVFDEYDNENYVVIVKKDSKNLFIDLGLCCFKDEMEYLDMPVESVTFKGERGYKFSGENDKEDIEDEIRRFILHNNI